MPSVGSAEPVTMLFAILIVVDLAVLFLVAHYLTGSDAFLGGLFLILTSIFSFYAATATLLNTMTGKTILSMGNAMWKP